MTTLSNTYSMLSRDEIKEEMKKLKALYKIKKDKENEKKKKKLINKQKEEREEALNQFPTTRPKMYKVIKNYMMTSGKYNKEDLKKLTSNYKNLTKKDFEYIYRTIYDNNFAFEFHNNNMSKWRKYGRDKDLIFPLRSHEVKYVDSRVAPITTTTLTYGVPYYRDINQLYKDLAGKQGFREIFGKNIPFRILFKGEVDDDAKSTFTSTIESVDPIPDLLLKIHQFFAKYNSNTILEFHIIRHELREKRYGANDREEIKKFNENYHIFSPKSKVNCLYQALKIAATYEKDPKILSDAGKRAKAGSGLKERVNPSEKWLAGDKNIQECCNYLKREILLYNDELRIEKHYIPEKYHKGVKKEPLRIYGANNHMCAIIKKEYAPIKEKKSSEEDEYLHDRIRNNEVINRKIMVFDLETALDKFNTHTPYAAGLAWRDYTKEDEEEKKELLRRYKQKDFDKSFVREDTFALASSDEPTQYKSKQFWGLDCQQNMMNFIEEHLEKFSGYTLYAHNGGRFDFNLLLRHVLIKKKSNFYVDGSIEQDGSWIHLVVRHKKNAKFRLIFRDSIKIFSCGLNAITRDLKVKHGKLEVDHHKITLDNYMKLKPEIEPYLENDVLGLLEAVCIFNETVFKSINIDMTKCMTAASLAKKNFYMNHYNKFKNPVHQLTKEQDRFIRSCYFGGRTECFRIGEIEDKKIYYYDFTSLYPSMRDKDYPIGKPVYVPKWNESMFGFVRCDVRTKDFDKVPIHGFKDETSGKLVFPHLRTWKELILFSGELDHSQYDYNFKDGYCYKSGKLLKSVWEEGFIKKAEAKKAGKPALASLFKLIINSTYGFFGLRFEERDSISYSADASKLLELLLDNKLEDWQNMGGYYACKVKGDLDTKRFNVGVAAAVTSYSRKRITELINAIRYTKDNDGKNYQVFYCDTDSVITNCPVEEIESLREEFIPDGTGKALGSLKNEMSDIDPNRKYFTHCVIAGLKQYALKADGILIKKLKGMSKRIVDKEIDYDHFIGLVHGEKITKGCEYFSIPRGNFMNKENPNFVGMKYGDKTVRSFYDKGVKQEDGVIKPLEFIGKSDNGDNIFI